MEAIADYAKYTCVRFRPKMSSDGDYLRIFKGEGCWSYVGRQGGWNAGIEHRQRLWNSMKMNNLTISYTVVTSRSLAFLFVW